MPHHTCSLKAKLIIKKYHNIEGRMLKELIKSLKMKITRSSTWLKRIRPNKNKLTLMIGGMSM
jgi:hypothetical protein